MKRTEVFTALLCELFTLTILSCSALGLTALSLHILNLSHETYAVYGFLMCVVSTSCVAMSYFLYSKKCYADMQYTKYFNQVITVFACCIAFFTLIPVTIERSISVYMIEKISLSHKNIDQQDLQNLICNDFTQTNNAVRKRIAEQQRLGTLSQENNTISLTPKGHFIHSAIQATAILFAVPNRAN